VVAGNLPGSDQVSQALGFQTIDDTEAIIEKADGSGHVLVMGGSFIGYELAEGVSFRKTAKVTWIMRGPWFLRYVLDEEGGRLLAVASDPQGSEAWRKWSSERDSRVSDYDADSNACHDVARERIRADPQFLQADCDWGQLEPGRSHRSCLRVERV